MRACSPHLGCSLYLWAIPQPPLLSCSPCLDQLTLTHCILLPELAGTIPSPVQTLHATLFFLPIY